MTRPVNSFMIHCAHTIRVVQSDRFADLIASHLR